MKVTTDHDEIRLWAEAHDGRPEVLQEPDVDEEQHLRLDFPGKQDNVYLSDNTPEKNVSWDDFFTKFDRMGLAFEFDEKIEGNDVSSAYRFIKRTRV